MGKKDVHGKVISNGDRVKYSFNEFGVPVFTGTIVIMDQQFFIEHSNKITVKLDEEIRFIEVLP